ncbi:hypothetical protein DPMN_158907 [Dreissena polymorpha]|uniref:Uncharacterized protein n=1 Tax=Dreissena polymorpha TaxID=45954 RepID=A0A9D4ENC4_DREPO|nr:hypothetical protein DPMN_158907 [Dreissena polymorpha]
MISGLQMTEPMTTVFVIGLTSDTMLMLTVLNDDITKKTHTIVSEARKIILEVLKTARSR